MMSCGEVETTLPSQELNSRERLDNLVEFSDWRRAWQVDVSGVTLLDCGAGVRSGPSRDWTVPTSDGSNHFPWPPSHRAPLPTMVLALSTTLIRQGSLMFVQTQT